MCESRSGLGRWLRRVADMFEAEELTTLEVAERLAKGLLMLISEDGETHGS